MDANDQLRRWNRHSRALRHQQSQHSGNTSLTVVRVTAPGVALMTWFADFSCGGIIADRSIGTSANYLSHERNGRAFPQNGGLRKRSAGHSAQKGSQPLDRAGSTEQKVDKPPGRSSFPFRGSVPCAPKHSSTSLPALRSLVHSEAEKARPVTGALTVNIGSQFFEPVWSLNDGRLIVVDRCGWKFIFILVRIRHVSARTHRV
jgi:hypothetical protein